MQYCIKTATRVVKQATTDGSAAILVFLNQRSRRNSSEGILKGTINTRWVSFTIFQQIFRHI